RDRKWPFAFAFGSLIIASAFILPQFTEAARRIYVTRNFFGLKMVLADSQHGLRRLVHGDTIHGVESLKSDAAGQAMSYYHPTGPAGDVMKLLDNRRRQTVGVIGLGAGSLASYARPGRPMTFFEIDREMEVIARRFFTFLDRCNSNCRVIIGDG